MNNVVILICARAPLAPQIPAGMILQFKSGMAIAAPRLLAGWSRQPVLTSKGGNV